MKKSMEAFLTGGMKQVLLKGRIPPFSNLHPVGTVIRQNFMWFT